MTEPSGTVIGGYTVERTLGAGGMGAVYAARHPRLPRVDALKVLSTSIAGDPAYRARFEREADLAGRLDHPNIVAVYDRGEDAGRLWMSMRLVPGSDASVLLAAHPNGLPLPQVLTIVDAVASALDYAHGTGLLHRDVKPGNIMIDSSAGKPRVLLGDFGIARRQQDNTELTQLGMVVGTVDYASPEQLSGLAMDGRSDQYSLACTAVHLLTGHKPFASSASTKVISDHLMSPPPLPSRARADLSPAIDRVIARGMAKQPQARYGSCAEFAAALRAAAGAPTPAPTGYGPPSNPQLTGPTMPLTTARPSGPTGPAAPGWGAAPSGYPQGGPMAPQPGYVPAPAKKSRTALVVGLTVAVVLVLVVAVLGVIGAISGDDGPDTTTAAPASSTVPTSTTPAFDTASVLRGGYIDPCLIPARVYTDLGLTVPVDDPGQRGEDGVKLACQSTDNAAGGGAVKLATFAVSSSWVDGAAVAGLDKWHTFTVPSTNTATPDYCVTAYNSSQNGYLYVGLQQTTGRDCGRGVAIARALDPYLPD